MLSFGRQYWRHIEHECGVIQFWFWEAPVVVGGWQIAAWRDPCKEKKTAQKFGDEIKQVYLKKLETERKKAEIYLNKISNILNVRMKDVERGSQMQL